MKCHLAPHANTGLTILELLLVVIAISVLCVLLFPYSHGCKGHSATVACLNNLKQLALSELVWANDHGHESLPAQLSTNAGGFREIALSGQLKDYYKALSNELASPRILTCPSNRRAPVDDFRDLTADRLSYFLNADGSITNNEVVNGDQQIQFTPPARGGIVSLEPSATFRWRKGIHHKNDERGNVALADGSVQRTSTPAEMREAFQALSQGRQRIVLP